MSTILVTLDNQDRTTGIFVSDILDWQVHGAGGSEIRFRNNRPPLHVTETPAALQTAIEAALARPAAALAGATYTPTNVTPDRSFDADTVAVAELADVVGTLIDDLQTIGLIG